MMLVEEARPDRLSVIADQVGQSDFEAVAAAILGLPNAVLADGPRIVPLTVHHYDNRTVGMLHVTGFASEPGGQPRNWSAVVKVIDLGQAARANNFVTPEHEILVYQNHIFATEGHSFRPAQCYRISAGSGGTTLLWLEDLTEQRTPPFTSDELGRMAFHLGSWNGYHALHRPQLPLEMTRNSFLVRWGRSPIMRQIPRLRELLGHRFVRDAYRQLPLDVFEVFQRLTERLNAITALLPPALCFGDCNVGNLFAKADETVAVDWASLALDPLGVDMGCMVGSAIAWGREGSVVAEAEHWLFQRYAEGVASTGWKSNNDDLRRAFFGHFGGYLCFAAAIPALLVDEVFPIHLLEKRFGAPADEIPGLVSGVIALLPNYIEELNRLGVS